MTFLNTLGEEAVVIADQSLIITILQWDLWIQVKQVPHWIDHCWNKTPCDGWSLNKQGTNPNHPGINLFR